EQVMRIASTEPTLRDMLQQFRHLFDHVVYGPEEVSTSPPRDAASNRIAEEFVPSEVEEITFKSVELVETPGEVETTIAEVESPVADAPGSPGSEWEVPPEPSFPVVANPGPIAQVMRSPALTHESLTELWRQEQRA